MKSNVIACLSHETVSMFSRAVIGELDEEVDARLDMSAIKAEPLNAIVH